MPRAIGCVVTPPVSLTGRSHLRSLKRDTITQNDPPCQNGPSRRSGRESPLFVTQ